MFFLGLAVACLSFTIMLQMALNDNFLNGEFKITFEQKGQLESVRETCGILALGVLALLAGLSEPVVAAAMLVLVGAGMSSYAFIPECKDQATNLTSFLWVMGLSLVWSQGLHVWMPLPNSMALGLAEPGKAGYRLGQINAAGAAGSFVALGVAIGLCLFCQYQLHWNNLTPAARPLYIIAGVVAVLGAAACLAIPRSIKTERPRLVVRSKYKLYYLLCLLEGWRKQVFLAFAGILLVKQFHADLMTMLALWTVTQVVGYFAAKPVGSMIDRVGERRVLLFYYVAMIVIFVGYALLPGLGAGQSWPKYLLYGLFMLDGSFFVLAMALTTYVNKIAPPSEHTPTLSMGVAMNHVAAVSMPLVGGLLSRYDITWTFLLGCAAGVASIIAATRLPRRQA